jgi:arylsulfatase A
VNQPWIWTIVALSLLGFHLGKDNPCLGSDRLPNIVLIVADDLGYGEVGCYGQQWIQTPVLDQLAKEGVRYTQFYSGNAVCAPSRCCLMTGKHPGHAAIRNNGRASLDESFMKKMGFEFSGQNPLPADELTLAESLKKAGYATGAMGKWGLGHFGTSGDPNTQGFDLFYGFNCQGHAHNHYPNYLWRNRIKEPQPGNDRTLYGETYSQDQFVKEGIKFIEEHQDQPFFLYLPFAVPHLSIQVPQETLDLYVDKIPEAEYKHRGYLEHPKPRAGYAAMVTHMDQGIGEVLRKIEELHLRDNTLVIFTSDNGPTYDRLGGSDSDFFDSAAGLRGRKGSFYEGGIRVPLIVSWPGKIPQGETRNEISAFWDLMPTILDLAGEPIPSGLDGLSLKNNLTSADAHVPREALYWEFPAYGGQQALRWGDWKAIRPRLLGKTPSIEMELYNLAEDPSESRNLASEHPELVEKISQLMKASRVPSPKFPIPILDRPIP